jgi:hypothetical protein
LKSFVQSEYASLMSAVKKKLAPYASTCLRGTWGAKEIVWACVLTILEGSVSSSAKSQI